MKHVVFQNFTTADLKPGYVVKLAKGDVCMVVEIGNRGSLILLGPDCNWEYLSKWNSDLSANIFSSGNPYSSNIHRKIKEYNIVEVYGHVNSSDHYGKAFDISTAHRPLLWCKQPVKQLTVAEIEEQLGYKIEIVSDK